MTSKALHTGSRDSVERLDAWLRREEGSHEGAAEELDWLVGEARRELAAADDPQPMMQLAERLAAWAGHEDADAMACAALMHACRLAEDAGEVDAACDYAEWALQRDPTDRAPMAALHRLLEPAEDLARLEAARITQVDLLAERAAYEHELRLQALRSLGTLRAEKLHDLDSAIDAYQQALEIEATDSTIQALADLYLRRDHAGDADDAAELYFQLAERAAPEAARPLLEMALDIQPDHEGALMALQQVSEGAEGVDEEQLVSRMVTFASVAPAGQGRDSVVEELKRRNSDVSELEAATGEAPVTPDEPPPEALAPPLPPSGTRTAAATMPYAHAVAPSPSAGVG